MTDQPKTTENLYALILGLPEEVTSPNHYELLGLDGRTNDPQVIKDAAADQNRKLLGWQNSDRYAEVRAMTFEVVQARDTLLNQDSRDTYNADLGDWGVQDEGPWIVEEPQPTPPSSSEPLSVRCPDCEAEFKLRNRDLIGRRIPCPECGFRFTVTPEPEIVTLDEDALIEELDSDAELTALENFEDMDDLPTPASKRAERSRSRQNREEPLEDDYEDYEPIDRERPRDRGRSRTRTAVSPKTRRPPSRRSESRSSGKWSVLGGAGLMALGIIVFVVALVQRMVSPAGSASSDRLAYLPADCESVAYYRLGDVAREPSFQNHLTRDSQLRQAADQFRDRMGMELQDIDSLIVGLKEGQQSRFQSLRVLSAPPTGLTFVAVVRSSKDWDRTKLIGDHTQSTTYNNLTYHTFSPDGQSQEKWAFYLADARTLLLGSEAELRAAMDTQGRVPGWSDVEFLRQEFAIVAARLPGSNPGSTPQSTLGPRPSGRTVTINGAKAQQLGSGLLLEGNTLQSVTFLGCESETEAANYIALREQANQRLRQMRSPRPGRNPGWPEVRFKQYGRTVAVIEDRRMGNLGFTNSSSLSPPLSLLARLGKGSSTVAQAPTPQPNPPVNPPPNTPQPNAAAPNDLGPPPDGATLDALIADLQDDHKAKAAARKLAKMTPIPARQKEVAALLTNMLKTRGHFEKQAAADALGVWGSSDDVPLLLEQLDGRDVFLKKHVLPALGQLRDPQALPGVIASLKDYSLRRDAINALELIPGAETELLKVLSTLSRKEWQLRQGICDALRTMGTRQSLPQLEALASSPVSASGTVSPSVRASAISAVNTIRSRNR